MHHDCLRAGAFFIFFADIPQIALRWIFYITWTDILKHFILKKRLSGRMFSFKMYIPFCVSLVFRRPCCIVRDLPCVAIKGFDVKNVSLPWLDEQCCALIKYSWFTFTILGRKKLQTAVLHPFLEVGCIM